VEQRNSKAAGAGQVRVGVVLEGGSGEEGGEGLRGLRQERWVPRFWRWSGQGGVERAGGCGESVAGRGRGAGDEDEEGKGEGEGENFDDVHLY